MPSRQKQRIMDSKKGGFMFDYRKILMRPKFQKSKMTFRLRSALKFDGRIIPEAKYPEGHLRPSGIN